ncbi:hypothetical protein J3F84DRAFT_377933 [Trichoderma pleuroticola]
MYIALYMPFCWGLLTQAALMLVPGLLEPCFIMLLWLESHYFVDQVPFFIKHGSIASISAAVLAIISAPCKEYLYPTA